MGKRFVITRVASPPPENIDKSTTFEYVNEYREFTGDQYEWGWALPAPFRALANPVAPTAFPRKPDESKDFAGALSYWLSLQHLLVYRLGWCHPGVGMAELIERELLRDNPEADDTVLLVKELWFEDGYLRNYLDWALTKPESFHFRRRTFVHAISEPLPDEMPASAWKHSPFGLHLESSGGHYFQPGGDPASPGEILAYDQLNRSATILIEHARGWYETLCRLGEQLPPVNDRSIKVNVYVKPIGFMGTYRQSRVTGLWFTGSHSIHMMGNVEE